MIQYIKVQIIQHLISFVPGYFLQIPER